MKIKRIVAAACVLLSTGQVVQGRQQRAPERVERGELTRQDETLESGEFVDTYSFRGAPDQRVRLELSASGFDGYLVLVAPDGEQLENDDADGHEDLSVIEAVLEQHGTYEVLVTSFEEGERGRYTLRMSLGDEEPRRSRDRQPSRRSAAGRPRIHGVFVGISDYEGEDEDLDYTADDARRLRQDLIDGAGMRAEDAPLLVDGGATLAAFRRAVTGVAGRASADDLVVLFFSGHGDRVERSAPQAADPDGFDETITMHDGELTDDEMNRLLGGIRARVLLVLDSCYSGGFSKDVISAPGRMGLFSSEEDVMSSVADEFRAGGYLAKFMAEGIGEWRADADGDDDITAIELSDYLHDRYRADVDPAPRHGGRGKTAVVEDAAHQRLVVDRGSLRPGDVVLRRDGAGRTSGRGQRYNK